MSKDETIKIDGATVAAQILSCLPPETSAKIVRAIRTENPESAARIEQIMLSAISRPKAESSSTIESIAQMNDKDVQLLMRKIEPRDIVVALKAAPKDAQEKMLQNLSQSKKQEVLEEMRDLPKLSPKEIEATKTRVVKTIDDLYGTKTPEDTTPRRLRSRLA